MSPPLLSFDVDELRPVKLPPLPMPPRRHTHHGVSVQEILAKVEAMPADERRRLAAFLVSLRHKDLADYRARMAQKIDDDSPENWVTLEEMDHRLTT
jgi:hypothetical protein